MSWRLARWCVVAGLGCAFPAPAEGHDVDPKGKVTPCEPPAPVGEVSPTASGAEVAEPQCVEAQAIAAKRPQGARGSGEVEQEVTGLPSLRHGILLVTGVGLATLGLGFAIDGFSRAGFLRGQADHLESDLEWVGHRPCTAARNVPGCLYSDDLRTVADIWVGVGVGSLMVFGAGATLAVYQVVKAFPPARTAVPQVAFTPAPGGGVLVIRGNF